MTTERRAGGEAVRRVDRHASMGDQGGLVTWRVNDGVALLTLNDPARRNALSTALSRDLARAVTSALSFDVGAIVLTAAPPVFSAGGDLDALSLKPVPLDELYEGFLALADAAVPTLAVVDGPAVGAGLNFALACDVVLTTPRAVIDPRFIDVGMHPGGGHLWRLDRRIGRQGTAALVLFGKRLSGQEAVTHGLAWECWPSEDVLDVAMQMAGTAASRDRSLLVRTKATMRAGDAMTTAGDAVAAEREAQQWAVSRPEFGRHLEAIKARVDQEPRS
ncbi:MAG: hypothetical protein QOG99_195 [Frankiales bacterium]|nr:hypothetical protein [Frankiales bacterium]